jgi:hypothetical protein
MPTSIQRRWFHDPPLHADTTQEGHATTQEDGCALGLVRSLRRYAGSASYGIWAGVRCAKSMCTFRRGLLAILKRIDMAHIQSRGAGGSDVLSNVTTNFVPRGPYA